MTQNDIDLAGEYQSAIEEVRSSLEDLPSLVTQNDIDRLQEYNAELEKTVSLLERKRELTATELRGETQQFRDESGRLLAVPPPVSTEEWIERYQPKSENPPTEDK